MNEDEIRDIMARSEALAAQATQVFKPRSPITTKELFAGRWAELTSVSDAVHQPGLHVVIYGERGVGKTSLANVVAPTIVTLDNIGKESDEQTERLVLKAVANSDDSFSSLWHRIFTEILWPEQSSGIVGSPVTISTREAFSLPDNLEIDDVRRVLAHTPGAVFIFDEFDQSRREVSRSFTQLIKTISDLVIDCTVIVVGVSETVDNLISDHASIVRALTQIRLERMKSDELQQILINAEKVLQLKFTDEATTLIVNVSQGLPHYTHLIGLNAVRSAAARFSLTEVNRDDVFEALKKAVKQAQQSVTDKHSTAIHSSHKSALYRHVLLACALAASRSHDPLGFFSPSSIVGPLKEILGRPVKIATFTNHLSEFCEEKHGSILERDGQPWGYRYRFRDPLLVPFIFMDGLEAGIATGGGLVQMLE